MKPEPFPPHDANDPLGHLALSRNENETINVSGPCTVKVVKTTKGTVRLLITAAQSTRIMRGEVDNA